MTVTRATRLIDLFDFPDRVFAKCARRRVRTVGELLDLVGTEPSVLEAAFSTFLGRLQWDHHQDCQDAAAVIAEIAGKLRPEPAGVTG